MARIRGRLAASLAFCIASQLVVPFVAAEDRFKSFKLKTPEGETKSLREFLGRATLVTFFFPTCGYCNAEFPHIAEMYKRYKEQGLLVVAINIERDQDRMVTEWKKKHGYEFPVLVGASLDKLVDDYDLKATPTNVVLDPSGKEVYRHAGYKTGDEKELEIQIRKVLHLQD